MSEQRIDFLAMQSMTWLRARLNWWKDEGYTIDSVVVFDGEVIIVRHPTTATPELLEACKMALAWIENAIDAIGADKMIDAMPNNCGGRIQLRDAIAKVTKESNAHRRRLCHRGMA